MPDSRCDERKRCAKPGWARRRDTELECPAPSDNLVRAREKTAGAEAVASYSTDARSSRGARPVSEKRRRVTSRRTAGAEARRGAAR